MEQNSDKRLTHKLFEEQCALNPERIALKTAGTTMSYGELNRQSNQLAWYLRQKGVAQGDLIALCLSPACTQVISLLALFKLGATYVPLDPTHPLSHTKNILKECSPVLLITEGNLTHQDISNSLETVFLDEEKTILSAQNSENLDASFTLDCPAYIIFTSGTTGNPKGVLATHQNLAHYLDSARKAYGFGPTDVFSSTARFTFSISLWELLSPLCVGASLRLFTRDEVLKLDTFCKKLLDITVLHAGPSLLASIMHHLETPHASVSSLPNMRHASSGGDVVPPHTMERMKTLFPHAELYVIYGSTEISCMGATYPIPRDTLVDRSYVGKPFPNTKVRLVDEEGKPTIVGHIGEICFSGAGVVSGYFRRPELTLEKFVPFNGEVFYKMGDLGRMNEGGDLEILGRTDFQIQLRGMRIEPLTIESAFRTLKLAEECAISLKNLNDRDARLIAFVSEPHQSAESSLNALRAELPDYMIPHHIVEVDNLPLTLNGKLDRRALEKIPWQARPNKKPSVEPRSLIEEKVCGAFSQLLQVPVGIDDNFFDLGGHSLLVMMLASELENQLGFTVSPAAIFQTPTPRALVEYLKKRVAFDHHPIALTSSHSEPALFLIAGIHIYQKLAHELEGKLSVYGVYAGVEFAYFDQGAQAQPVEELAARYVEIIRRQQSHGPYQIAGLSFGGIIAYEIAQQLIFAGEVVTSVTLLDSMLPEVGWRSRFRKVLRFARLSPQVQAQLLVQKSTQKARTIQAHLQKHRAKKLRKQTTGQMQDTRIDAYRQSAELYVSTVKDCPAPVSLVIASQRAAQSPLACDHAGWRDHVSHLALHSIDSGHLELLQEPRVSNIAQILLNASAG